MLTQSGALEPAELEVLLFGEPLCAARKEKMLAIANRERRHRERQTRESDAARRGGGGLVFRLLPLFLLGGGEQK